MERILRLLAPLCVDRQIVLVGGQAVAFWMRLFLDCGIDPFRAVLVDPRLPPAFGETRYPQMRAKLRARRERDRRPA